MKPTNFSFEGAPHRPLSKVVWSEHLQGEVASTGNSSLHRVLEGLKTFGGRGYTSPRREHWEAVCERYGESDKPVRRKGGKPPGRKQTSALELLAKVKGLL